MRRMQAIIRTLINNISYKKRGSAMRKTIALLLIVFSLLSFAHLASAHIPCMCDNPPDQCTCFIQLGDKGLAVKKIIEVLQNKGYLHKIDQKNEFTVEVKQAVLKFQADNNLECTGWMDDETLNALLNNVLPDQSYKNTAEFWDAICYVPTDGGQRHHANPKCSEMLNPRMISRVNAMSLGIKPCGKKTCTQSSILTYSSLGLKPRSLPDEYYTVEEDDSSLLSAAISGIPGSKQADPGKNIDDTEAVYIGNKNSHVFHRNTCSSAVSMSEKNKIEFISRDEAVAQGYKPCKQCKP